MEAWLVITWILKNLSLVALMARYRAVSLEYKIIFGTALERPLNMWYCEELALNSIAQKIRKSRDLRSIKKFVLNSPMVLREETKTLEKILLKIPLTKHARCLRNFVFQSHCQIPWVTRELPFLVQDRYDSLISPVPIKEKSDVHHLGIDKTDIIP